MSIIINHGEARNITRVATPSGWVPDPTVKKFVTFLTDHGAVHTVIVDAEHAAQDAESLLKWFEHTRAGVELSSNRTTSPYFKTAEQVISDADAALGFVAPDNGQSNPPATTQGQGVSQ